MKKRPYLILVILCFSAFFKACEAPTEAQKNDQPTSNTVVIQQDSNITDSIPIGLKKIIAAYPEQKFKATTNYLLWADGSKILYQDTVPQKSFEQLLNNADLEDQMAMLYLKGEKYDTPSRNHDPGRIRVEDFFFKMYGNSKEAVQKNLTTISFLGANLQVTKVNNIHQKLLKIAEELAKLPEFKKYLENVGGTFNWRKIDGTERMSTHSFGMTIDINVKYSNYWRWEVQEKAEDGKRPIIYKNQIPLQIVKIFEDNGFIWGGKWYHYDTMHFEYRPELLIDL